MLNTFSSEQCGTCCSLLLVKWSYPKTKTTVSCLDTLGSSAIVSLQITYCISNKNSGG